MVTLLVTLCYDEKYQCYYKRLETLSSKAYGVLLLNSYDESGVTMAKIIKLLTDTEVKRAKPTEKEYNLPDGQGLFLRVKPNGSKLWIMNYYRPITKQRNNIGLIVTSIKESLTALFFVM